MIETHEHKGDFKEWQRTKCLRLPGQSAILKPRYDYQIYYPHFCNRPCQHLSCARSISHPRWVARGIAFTGCRSNGLPFAHRETHSHTEGNPRKARHACGSNNRDARGGRRAWTRVG